MTGRQPAAFVVVAVVVLGALVASTAHTSVWGGARTGVADPLVLLAIVAIAFALSGVGTVALRQLAGRSGRAAPGLPHASVVIAVLVSLLAISRVELGTEAPPTGAAAEAQEDGPPGTPLRSDWRGPATRRDAERSAAPQSSLAFGGVGAFRRIVLIAGALVLVLALALRRRGSAASEEDVALAEAQAARAAAHDAIVGTIEAMLADPDPRTAIIGAYARLQEELSRSDASRRDYEGPTEHLRRVLGRLDVRPDPLRRLIGLFEVARFSVHELTARHREQALTALRDVASDLASDRAPDRASDLAPGRPSPA